jgi:peroxiredoxin
VALKTQDGKAVALPELIDDGRPVLLNFIYTSCTAICPPMTRIFAEVQDKLGADRARVRIVSVSIDPEEDTPKRLRDYARQFGAAEPWVFLTGSSAASESVQKAFNAYRPDKMGHTPLTFLRRAPASRGCASTGWPRRRRSWPNCGRCSPLEGAAARPADRPARRRAGGGRRGADRRGAQALPRRPARRRHACRGPAPRRAAARARHRLRAVPPPSGLGTVEGVAIAPAITGRHLFSPGQPRAGRRPRQAPA